MQLVSEAPISVGGAFRVRGGIAVAACAGVGACVCADRRSRRWRARAGEGAAPDRGAGVAWGRRLRRAARRMVGLVLTHGRAAGTCTG